MLAKNYGLCELHEMLLLEPLFWKPEPLLLTEVVEQLLVSPCPPKVPPMGRLRLKVMGSCC